jgi:alcohol dehydrogenase class IV
LRERAPGGAFIRRYDEVAQILSGDPGAVAEDGVAWAKELAAALNVPGLSAYGLGVDDLPELIEKSAQASSMRGNPIQLTPTEMRKILIDAL